MGNYRDGPEVEKSLLESFEKEEAEGRMFPLSFAEAQKRYPGSALRVAAQAVIPKPDQDGARRYPRGSGQQRDRHE